MSEKKYKIDHDLVFKLASIHCSYEEIADVVDTSVPTLKKRFSKIIDKGRAEGKKSLRRAQFEAAVEKKDVRMLIWLGKQLLGQTDNTNDTEGQQPLPWQE
jgi:hypothetical protein